MAKILLGDVILSCWELDPFSQALLPLLCRSTGVSFLEDKEGNFILEPPLGNKTIVLRPLTIPDQGLKALLTTLSQGLHDRGANVLIVPAMASDGRLFRLWQTQVLFAFAQKEAASAEPVLRFFYAPKRREESLGLIAALVQAMLRSEKPLSYTIPGSWEHFKNFRYRHLLNNADVPSVLIEFCQASLDEEVVHNIATWLVGGLTRYFQKPPGEEIVFKLQSLLQRLRDACFLPASKTPRGDGEALVTVRPAGISEETGTMASGTDMAWGALDPLSDDKLMVTPAGQDEFSPPMGAEKEAAEAENAGVPLQEKTMMSAPGGVTDAMVAEARQEFTAPAEGEIPIQEVQPEPVKVKGQIEAPEQAKFTLQQESRVTGSEKDQGSVPARDKAPVTPPPLPAKVALMVAKSPGPGYPATGITTAAIGTSNQPLVPVSPVKGLNGRPAKRRQRGNPFAPPGDGPVFIFKRPLEASLVPSFFPQEVLERMAPLPLQSTFLVGEQWRNHFPSAAADTALAGFAAAQAPRPKALKQPPDDPDPIRTAIIQAGTETPETGKKDSPLAELKNLSAAILAPQQLQEPLNGEAPSI